MKVLLVLLSLAFALVSGNENSTTVAPDEDEPDNIITNGYNAFNGQAPYLVSLLIGTDGSNRIAIGGGTIIGNTWVLTAAHCLTTDFVDIHYGSNWRGRGQFAHRVRRDNYIRHHLWPNTNGNDIGLIRTPYVGFTWNVDKVILPTFNQRSESFENYWGLVCGWGVQDNGQLADWLQCVDLQIMNNNECSSYYDSLPAGILCGRSQAGRSTCGGDSGVPLVITNTYPPTLVGITSFVSAAGCTVGHPAGFTRVTPHLDWIRQYTGIAY